MSRFAYSPPTLITLGCIRRMIATADGHPHTLASVVAASGWALRISAHGDCYDATLTNPAGSPAYVLAAWPSLDSVFESISTWLGTEGSSTARALRLLVEAEMGC